MAILSDFRLHTGDPAPGFSLPATDGRTYGIDDFRDARLLGVVFWCNHCPYVLGWEDRMIDIGRRFAPRGVRFALVNSNDAVAYPEDRFERMVERAREKSYPFPYLRDDSQEVARAYGALVTPHPLLFGPDRRLLYQGRIDPSHDRPHEVTEHPLAEALEAALAGRPVPRAELPVQGCSVKWRA